MHINDVYYRFIQFRQSRFVRSVAVVTSGNAGAQAITLASAPFITRLYGPEAFGVLGAYMAVVTIASPVVALAYPIAIVLPQRDEEALGLLRLCAIAALVITALTTAVLWLGGDFVVNLLSLEGLGHYIYLLPVAMLASVSAQMAQQWLVRKKSFGLMARISIVQSGVLNGAKVIGGLVMPSGVALVVLTAVGQVFHSLLMSLGIKYRTKVVRSNSEKDHEPRFTEIAWRYRDFPLYRAPQDFINAASQSLPVLLLVSFFGAEKAGFYVLGFTVMNMPSVLLGKAVADVFYSRITEAARGGEDVPRMIIQATLGLLSVGLLPFGVVFLLGPWLFSGVFGEGWSLAGEYARWLGFFSLFGFINKASVAAVPVLGIQKGLLIYEIFSTSSKMAVFVGAVLILGSDIWAVALFSIVGAVAYLAMIVWIVVSAKNWCEHAKTS